MSATAQRCASGLEAERDAARSHRPRVLFVGAFVDRPGGRVAGGNLAACKALLESSLPEKWNLVLLDSTTRSVPPPPVPMRIAYALARAARFAVLTVRHRPDAILLFSSGGLSFLEKGSYAILGRAVGIPSLLWIRDGRFLQLRTCPGLFRRLAAVILTFPRFLVCQGEAWRKFYLEVFGIPSGRCPIIENWLSDPGCLKIGAERRPRETTPVTILYVGWLERFKGLFELLDALRELTLMSALPPFRIRLVGDGGARSELEQLVKDRSLMGRVEFAGWQTGSAKRQFYTDADVFVFPSHAEGLPNAVVEAMAAGLPVVVTPVGCVPDLVQDGREGLLVPVGSSAALARALADLLTHPADRARMGRAAHEAAKGRFEVERAVDQLTELITVATRRPGTEHQGTDVD